MDTTPNKKMFDAMQKLTDAVCGDEPHPLMVGAEASRIRTMRGMMMDSLHQMVTLAMREGVNRAVREAQVRKQHSDFILDAEDRAAADQARDDAQAGRTRVRVRH